MALISKASLLMVPSTYTDGKLFNVLPSGNRAPDSTDQNSGYDQTRADFTFDRGSNLAATRVNASGLIEKGRENLLLQSNQFDTTWGNNNTTETSGQADKDGGTNAWLLNSTGSFGSIIQSFSAINGVSTLSIYAKAGTNNWLLLRMNATSDARAWFDLENGVLGSTDGPTIESKIEAIGTDGWYRCSITGNTSSFSQVLIYPTNANLVVGVAGSIYIQDAQLETGLVATDVMTSGSTTAKAGVLEDMPRINYDANGENGALLLEGLRTNKFLFSEYYGSGALGIYATGTNTYSVTNNYATSPEGVKNAIRFVADITSVGDRVVLRDGVSCGGGNHTLSFYAKSNTTETYTMKMHFDGSGKKQIEVTPEWQRFEYGESANTTCNAGIECSSASGYSASVDVSVYGFQLEQDLYGSSYIPTHGSAVSRSADSCSVTGVSDVIGQTEGTIYGQLGEKPTESVYVFEMGQGSSQYRFFVYTDTNKKLKVLVVDNYAVQVSYTSSVNVESNAKIAVAYDTNDYAIYLNGSELSTDTSASVPPMNQLAIGSDRSATTTLSVNLKQVALFNERLTNTELATLTNL